MVNAGQILPGEPTAWPRTADNPLIRLDFPRRAGWQASGMAAPE